MESLPVDLVRGLGVLSLLVGLFWMLATGKLATGRELRDKNDTIAEQRRTIAVLQRQLSIVLTEAMTTINPVLRALRDAASSQEEDGP